MAYFSNGTEGDLYFEAYCSRCEHLPEEEDRDCPIRSAHFFYNYDQHKIPEVKSILNMLIPRSRNGLDNEECAFFRQKQERLPL